MKKKLLSIMLILTLVVPFVAIEPNYAMESYWEVLCDVNATNSSGIAINATGPTSTYYSTALSNQGVIQAVQGTFVINGVEVLSHDTRHDTTVYDGCKNTGVLGSGPFDPVNYQYAILCYGVDHGWVGDSHYGTLSVPSHYDTSIVNFTWSDNEDKLLKEDVEAAYTGNNGFHMSNWPVNVLYNNAARSDIGMAAKFGNSNRNARIKVIRRPWPKPPRMEITMAPNQSFDSNITLSGRVYDPDLTETVTPYYSIDGGGPVAIPGIVVDRNIAANGSPFQNTVIDIANFAEGNHSISFWCVDSRGQKSPVNTAPFRIDRQPPVISSHSVKSTVGSISSTVVATDAVSGLHVQPYRYTLEGVEQTDWIPTSTYEKSGLLANTFYILEIQVRDNLEHKAIDKKKVCTLAQVPILKTSHVVPFGFRLNMVDSNPNDTEYEICVDGNKWVTPEGTLTTSKVWVTLNRGEGAKTIEVKGLEPSKVYTIKAKARNKNMDETDYSAPGSVTTKNAPPEAPTNLTITATDTSITGKWDRVSLATAYEIELDGQIMTNDKGKENDTTFTKANLSPSTPHTMRVRAKNTDGPGIWSEMATKTTNPLKPSTPTNLSLVPSSTMVTVTWNSVSGATGYDLMVDGTETSIQKDTYYKHTSLIGGSYHSYQIRSVNSAGKSPWSPKVETTLPSYSSPTPTNLEAVTTPGSITLNWKGVENATSYDIEVDGIASDNGLSTSYVHNEPSGDYQHKYRVRSKNREFISEWSSMVLATIKTGEYRTPFVKAEAQDTSIALSWNAVKDAIGYEVEVNQSLQDVGLDTQFVHGNLTPGQTYTYRVRAKLNTGIGEWSNLKSLKTGFYPAPQNLTTTASALSVQASWGQVAGATHYDIEFDGVETKDILETTIYKDNLKAGSQHAIKVRAKGPLGIGSWSPLQFVQTEGKQAYSSELTSIAHRTDIQLLWMADPTAKGYDVEADGSVYENVSSAGYKLGNLAPGSKHSFKIRTKWADKTGEWSKLITVMTLSEKPAIPDHFVASADMTKIQLTWDEVAGATGYDLEVDGTLSDVGASKSYLDKGLLMGSEHKYRIRSRSMSGVSDWSAILTKSTVNAVRKYEIPTETGEEFNLLFSGSNIQDLGKFTFTISYNPEELEVIDLCGMTSKIDLTAENIAGTDLKVEQFIPGTIVFVKAGAAGPNELWTSAANSIKFRAKKSGKSAVRYTISE